MGGAAKFYVEGGVFMHFILAAGVFGLGIIIERFIMLFFRYNINASAFMAQIQKLVMANNIDRAIKLCNAAASAALPRIIKAGLTRANNSEIEVSNAIEEETLSIVPNIQKRTQTLLAIANIATLLGLLGTIQGMIQAFESLGGASPEERGVLLSKGISVAMNTTAFGLLMAIPCMVCQIFLAGVTTKILNEMDQYSVVLTNLLAARFRAGVSGSAVG
jgi:biopolymer transport protein ExbB/TolQ